MIILCGCCGKPEMTLGAPQSRKISRRGKNRIQLLRRESHQLNSRRMEKRLLRGRALLFTGQHHCLLQMAKNKYSPLIPGPCAPRGSSWTTARTLLLTRSSHLAKIGRRPEAKESTSNKREGEFQATCWPAPSLVTQNARGFFNFLFLKFYLLKGEAI